MLYACHIKLLLQPFKIPILFYGLSADGDQRLLSGKGFFMEIIQPSGAEQDFYGIVEIEIIHLEYLLAYSCCTDFP